MGILGRLGRLASKNFINSRDVNRAFELDYTAVALPRNYLAGVVTSLEGVSSGVADDMNFAVGQRRNTGDTANILVNTTITKQIDATWAAGDDAGGMNDNAAAATGTWYHCFVLGKANTAGLASDIDAGFDTDFNATNLLADIAVIAAGYTTYRRVASMKTASGSAQFLDYTQRGNMFIPVLPIGNLNIGATSDTVETITLLGAPTGHSTLVQLNITAEETAAGETVGYIMNADAGDSPADIDALGAAPLANTISHTSGSDTDAQSMWIRTNTSAQIKHEFNGAGATIDEVNYAVCGWLDDLGQYD